MPDSSRLMPNRVWISPVVAPAAAPASAATAVATIGCVPCTSSTAVTAAPSVIEPSAVMSEYSKMRKLMKTPSASSDRINPTVSAPMRSVMRRSLRTSTRRA